MLICDSKRYQLLVKIWCACTYDSMTLNVAFLCINHDKLSIIYAIFKWEISLLHKVMDETNGVGNSELMYLSCFFLSKCQHYLVKRMKYDMILIILKNWIRQSNCSKKYEKKNSCSLFSVEVYTVRTCN